MKITNIEIEYEEHNYGCNPCSEIILRDKQFCNLTEVVVRPDDTLDSLKRKVRIASFLGTLQSTLTGFRYLSSAWERNTSEERLLGVSLTGIMDHPIMSRNNDVGNALSTWLVQLKQEAINENKAWAESLGIPQSAAITCVKPSGTVSQLVDSSSGIHPRYSRYYIRTVRNSKTDPLAKMLQDQGIPVEDSISAPSTTSIFSFPMRAPELGVLRDQVSAIEQLELWKIYQEYWCEHKPSITVYVRENEWLAVGAWVYDNFDIVSGVSFLPYDNGTYKQAPYQEITKEKYEELVAKMPTIDWTKLKDYETEDCTENTKELACSAGVCEI